MEETEIDELENDQEPENDTKLREHTEETDNEEIYEFENGNQEETQHTEQEIKELENTPW